MKKIFAIYRQGRLIESDKWTLHAKYETMSRAVQAWTDLIKVPRAKRFNRYVVLPLLDPKLKHIQIKPEHNEEVLKMSR